METMNPSHYHLMRRHTYGKSQYSIGSEVSPLTLMSTETPIKVFVRGEVYVLNPTKYKPAVNGKLTLYRAISKAELNIINRYNEKHPENQINTTIRTIHKEVDENEPMYHAIPRERLQRFSKGNSAKAIFEGVKKYIPNHIATLCTVDKGSTTYVRSTFVMNEIGNHYEVSLSKFGYYIIRPAKYIESIGNIVSTDVHLFKSMHYEGVLSWFLAMYYERKHNVSRSGITPEREWLANSERGEDKLSSIEDLDNGHIYNIGRWICAKLISEDMCYVTMYSVDLIETINEVLVNNIHQDEINRCCLGKLD